MKHRVVNFPRLILSLITPKCNTTQNVLIFKRFQENCSKTAIKWKGGLMQVVLWKTFAVNSKLRPVVSWVKDWLLLYLHTSISMHTHTAHIHTHTTHTHEHIHTQIIWHRREEVGKGSLFCCCCWLERLHMFLWERQERVYHIFKHIKTAEKLYIFIEKITINNKNTLVCYKRLPVAISHSILAGRLLNVSELSVTKANRWMISISCVFLKKAADLELQMFWSWASPHWKQITKNSHLWNSQAHVIATAKQPTATHEHMQPNMPIIWHDSEM